MTNFSNEQNQPDILLKSIFINLVEECIANALIERFFVADLGESRLSQRYNLISVERARIIFVILQPERVDDHVPLGVVRAVVPARRVGNLRSRRFVIVDATIRDLIWRILAFLAFLLDGTNLFLLHLLHLLLLLKVQLLLLLFNNLIHEDGLIDPFRCVKPWRPLSIPLDLVLVTQRDRTKRQVASTIFGYGKVTDCFAKTLGLNFDAMDRWVHADGTYS